jgi:hypothetical protein
MGRHVVADLSPFLCWAKALKMLNGNILQEAGMLSACILSIFSSMLSLT